MKKKKPSGYRRYILVLLGLTVILLAVFGTSLYHSHPVQAATQKQSVSHKTGLVEIRGKKYYFSKRGKKLTGWRKINKKYYYFDRKTGAMARGGVFNADGKRYYFKKNGLRKGGRIKIGKKWYAFDRKTGIQLRNQWYKEKDGSYYFAGNRYSLVTGFYKPDSSYRYFRPSDGKMLKGWQTIKGKRYLFNTRNGRRFDNCKINLKKNMYCFDSNGVLYQNSWATINGKTYYAGAKGLLTVGWFTQSGNTYYMNSAGEQQKGWINVGGKQYYMDPTTGIMARSTWIDSDHYVGADGVWAEGYTDKVFRWPLDSKYNVISSHFGKRTPPGPNTSSYHLGIDIGAAMGSPIYAAADGKVVLIQTAKQSGNPGNYTRILHDNGMITEYMHQSKFAANLKYGMRVKKGDIIGYVGNTGASYGAHLHFGVIVNNANHNPLNYVNIPK